VSQIPPAVAQSPYEHIILPLTPSKGSASFIFVFKHKTHPPLDTGLAPDLTVHVLPIRLVSLAFKPNCTTITLNVGFAGLTLLCVLLQWLLLPGGLYIGKIPFLGLVTLYYGVFIGSFSIYDIYDDLITRTVEGSDSHACYQLYPCCLPRCVGVLWAMIAFFFMAAGVYLALVWTG
jgi:hypothetical protein